MRRYIRRRLRWKLVPLALALTLVVFAVPVVAPAAAKGPVMNLNPCVPSARNFPPPHPRVDCDRFAAPVQNTGDGGGSDAGFVAGGAALLMLTTVGGVLVASRQRSAHGTRPATQS